MAHQLLQSLWRDALPDLQACIDVAERVGTKTWLPIIGLCLTPLPDGP